MFLNWKKLYAPYLRWKECSIQDDGVVVGSDQTQEWLLPWWWKNFRQHNAHPITFIDIGLSPEMKCWCQERGTVIHLPIADNFVTPQEKVDPSLRALWESGSGTSFWKNRSSWFKKPIACLQSPYKRSLWLDLDCEVRAPLSSLFALCDHPSGIALSLEPSNVYNSGVIVFKHGCSLIKEWASQVFKLNHAFVGDQELLSHIIRENNLTIAEISRHYNWSRCYENNPEAAIFHWHGATGKTAISYQIQRDNL